MESIFNCSGTDFLLWVLEQHSSYNYLLINYINFIINNINYIFNYNNESSNLQARVQKATKKRMLNLFNNLCSSFLGIVLKMKINTFLAVQ